MKEPGPYGLSPETTEKMRFVFRKYPKIEKVILYGSRAKGTHRPGSDIDLTIEGSQFSVSDLLELEGELDDLMLPYKVDLSLRDSIESKDLLEHIERVGQVFYARDFTP